MANIDFQFECPACRHRSGQCAPKPTLVTPTSGFVNCPECLCKIKIELSLKTDKPGSQFISYRIRHIHRSQRYKDRIQAQRERDAKLSS